MVPFQEIFIHSQGRSQKKYGLRQYPWLNSPPSCLGSSLNNVKTSLIFGSIIKKNWKHVMSMMRASTYRFLWKKLLFKRCILIDLIPHSDQTREKATKHMKTREFSLGSRCLVSMNFCLIFLILYFPHCLIRIIIKHNTMLR